MASGRWWSSGSTPELVSVVVLAAVVALPLALLGFATVTGWPLARRGVLGEYWFGLGLLDAVLAAPW